MTAPPPPDRLVVRTDRRLAGRVVRRGTVMLVCVLVICAALGLTGGVIVTVLPPAASTTTVLAALIGLLVAVIGFTAGMLTYFGGIALPQVHREVDVVAVVEPTGLYVAVPGTDAGSAYLPWHAVASVVPRGGGVGGGVVVRAVPGLRHDHLGARGLDDPHVWRQLTRRGLPVRTGLALVPREQVLAAVHHHRALAAGHPAH